MEEPLNEIPIESPDKGTDAEMMIHSLFDQSGTDEMSDFKRGELLKRLGFNQAIQTIECPLTELEKFIQEYKATYSKVTTDWDNVCDAVKKNIENKIAMAKADIEGIKNEETFADGELKLLEDKKMQILEQIKELIKNLFLLRYEFAAEKKGVTGKWMDEVEAEIEKVVHLQKRVYDETKLINDKKYVDRKPAFDIQVDQMKKARQYLHERHDSIHQQLILLGGDGITPFVGYLLIGLGTASAWAAGYFFSVFTNTTQVSSQDLFYYLLTSLIQASGSSHLSLLVKFLYVVAGLGAITCISWGCHWMYKTMFPKEGSTRKEKQRFQAYAKFKFEGMGSFGEVKAGSWFSYWLQIAPIIAVGGIMIIILSLNTQAVQQTNILNASTEGLLVGSVLAMGLSAIVYLYLTKVIEPRLIRHKENAENSRKLSRNWEISITLILFILSAAAVVFFPGSPDLNTKGQYFSNGNTVSISISLFISACLLAAFAVAYGTRFVGLINTGRFIQRRINSLDMAIAFDSIPEFPEVEIVYSERLQSMIDSLLGMTENKGQLLRNMGSNKAIVHLVPGEEGRSGFQKLLPWLSSSGKAANNAEKSLFDLFEWEAKYFPDFEERFKILASEYLILKNEIAGIENKMIEIYTDNDNCRLQKGKEIEKLSEQVRKWDGLLITLMFQRFETKKRRIQKEEMEVLFIKEGFHLGIWYRENHVGPGDKYYHSCIHIKTNGYAVEPVSQ